MTLKGRPPSHKGWYSISVDSLRSLFTFLVVLALAIAGYLGFRAFERTMVEGEAERTLLEAESLQVRLTGASGVDAYVNELEKARRDLVQARRSFEEQDFRRALSEATSVRNLLAWVAESLDRGTEAGAAQFITVTGTVSYRRGEDGDWQVGRPRASLQADDFVRTADNGSAEIMFANGTLFTVRPNTLFRLSSRAGASGSGQQKISMAYGWVNLNTNQSESGVETPEAEAVVDRSSFASVSYDRATRQARFVAIEGLVRVAGRDGEQRTLETLQEVTQQGDRLAAVNAIPNRPGLAQPADNVQLTLEQVDRVALAWDTVPGARRYALQVSRSPLFAENLIDRDDRPRAGATLGLRGEGVFFWRAAAINGAGVAGPWSEPRRLRVASFRGGETDREPPPLQLQKPEAYGSIFMVGGTTEAGAVVEVNGEAVAVGSDGSFRKAVQFTQEGWNLVAVVARDASGNQTDRRQKVFVELY